MMDMIEGQSNVKEYGYSESKKEVVLFFQNEMAYIYKNVPKEILAKKGSSINGWCHRNLKGNFFYERIDTQINLCNDCAEHKAFIECDCLKAFNTLNRADNIYYCENYVKDIK